MNALLFYGNSMTIIFDNVGEKNILYSHNEEESTIAKFNYPTSLLVFSSKKNHTIAI